MHDTLNPSVKFYIDKFLKKGKLFTLKGWIFHEEEEIENIYIKYNDTEIISGIFHNRNDVYKIYHNKIKSDINFKGESIGFEISFESEEEIKDVKFSCVFLNSLHEIATVPNPYFKRKKPNTKIQNVHPSIIAVDNFYSNPDEVREYALGLDFQHNKEYHKGQRTKQKTFFEGTREFLEDTLNKKITGWDNQPHNGVFQFCTAEDQLVYHTDGQTYAAVVFLTPNAPAECGTSFFKHKGNGLRKYPTDADCKKFNKSHEELYWDMFQGNFYDKTPWELVDTVGNVYNRMAIWDAKLVHAATQYFGSNKLDSRLFHMFFFDAE